ncbi:hypothetical protein AB1Y20_009683 [Prymnesium parvum]|uniref:Uncharacterized protein n=1 Tax=Prymnesium parvum TaxID=97485 RepID=A0AB34K124_PRYPA
MVERPSVEEVLLQRKAGAALAALRASAQATDGAAGACNAPHPSISSLPKVLSLPILGALPKPSAPLALNARRALPREHMIMTPGARPVVRQPDRFVVCAPSHYCYSDAALANSWPAAASHGALSPAPHMPSSAGTASPIPSAPSPGAMPRRTSVQRRGSCFSFPEQGAPAPMDLAPLQAAILELTERMREIERVTSMLHPSCTAQLQDRLRTSFEGIAHRLRSLDETLQTEQQKRASRAAIVLCAAARGFLVRRLWRAARGALFSWRSRELVRVGQKLLKWVRRREVIEDQIGTILRACRFKWMGMVFTAWRAVADEGVPARASLDAQLKARRHFRHGLQRKHLWAWRRVAHHAKLVEVRWVVRDGQRVALRKDVMDQMQIHLQEWHRVAKSHRAAKLRFRSINHEFFTLVFHELVQVVRRRRQTRLLVVDTWRNFDRAYRKLPFRAWYLYMVDQKLLRKMHSVLVRAFRRRIGRIGLQKILQSWYEYVVHKAVETRTRSQLLQSLRVQEELTRSVEQTLDDYSQVLVEAEDALEMEGTKCRELINDKEQLMRQLVEAELRQQAAEHEAVTLRGALRAYELRYPRAFPNEDGMERRADDIPLVVDKPAMETLFRLQQASEAITSNERYEIPPSGGSAADHELRRMRALVRYVLLGEMPDEASFEIADATNETKKRMQRALLVSRIVALSKNMQEPRELQATSFINAVPLQMQTDRGAQAVREVGLAQAAAARTRIVSSEIPELSRKSDVDPQSLTPAHQLALRMRQRRLALDAKLRQKINIYSQVPTVSAKEERPGQDMSLATAMMFGKERSSVYAHGLEDDSPESSRASSDGEGESALQEAQPPPEAQAISEEHTTDDEVPAQHPVEEEMRVAPEASELPAEDEDLLTQNDVSEKNPVELPNPAEESSNGAQPPGD